MAQVLPQVGQNYLAGLTGGLQAGGAIQDMNRQNALSQLYKTQGAGLAQGDPEAINALAALDPMRAYDMRRQNAADERADQQFQMQQDRFGMEQEMNEANLANVRQQMALRTAEEARKLSALELEEQKSQVAAALSGAAAAYQNGPEAIASWTQQNAGSLEEAGIDPAGVTYESFPAIVAGIEGAQEGLAAGVEMAGSFNSSGDAPSSVREYEFYASQERQAGRQPQSYGEWVNSNKRAGATNINVTNEGDGPPLPEYPKLEDGYVYKRGPDGNVLVDQNGSPTVVPITGGSVEQDRQQAETASDMAQASYKNKFEIVDRKITQALSMLEENGRWVAGYGSYLSGLPESDARDFQATIDTIKANLGFEELQQMRENSPTGGALGQVTEREIAYLQAIQGNLDTAQSPEQLANILREIQQRRRDFREERARIRSGGEPQATQQQASPQAEEMPAGGWPISGDAPVPQGWTEQDWKFVSPSERSSILAARGGQQ